MKTIVLAACILFCSSTYAQETTATELLRKCGGGSIKECNLFVEGVVSGMRLQVADHLGAMNGVYSSFAAGKDAETIKRAFSFIPALCMNPSMSTEEVVRVVLEYAKANKPDASTSAGELVFHALQDKFGCNVRF